MRIFKRLLASLIPTPKTNQVIFFVDESDNKLTRKDSDGTTQKYVPDNGAKVYKALLTQNGTNAPVATVLENTLGGEVVWSRTDVGSYVGFLEGAFDNKTWCSATKAATYEDSTNVDMSRDNVDFVLLRSYLPADTSYDGFSASILIEVYP